MSDHTPAPWRIGDAGMTIFGPKTEEPCPVMIAKLLPATPRCGSAEREANKKLLVASPDMLKVLRSVLQKMRSVQKHIDSEYALGYITDAEDELRETVLKLTGRTY